MAAHIQTGTMNAPSYHSQTLDHLGLVAGMVDELGLVSLINQMLPKAVEGSTVSYGHAVKAMIVNGLGFVQRALYLTPDFFRDKPVDRLVGEGIQAEQLNDDLLGRTLDKIYDYGLDKFYSPLSVQAVTRLGLNSDKAHLDSSSFHTDGVYNSANPPKDTEKVIHITRGYSRDHRPELNQLILQLICENQAGIPVLMKPLSGNSDDKTDFRETIKSHLNQLQTDVGIRYLVADSALYTAKTLPTLEDIYWITRVPETLTLAKEQIHTHAAALMEDQETQSLHSVTVTYADIQQRWLLVYSPQAYQRALKTVNRQLFKQSQKDYNTFQALCREPFACQADAETALAKWQKKAGVTEVNDVHYTRKARYRGRGRPAVGTEPDYYEVYIEGAIATEVAAYRERLERKSCFIIATNEQDKSQLGDNELLAVYKEQQTVDIYQPYCLHKFLFSVNRFFALLLRKPILWVVSNTQSVAGLPVHQP